jgi:hypothetical protein
MSGQVLIAWMLAFAVVLASARMLWRLRREASTAPPRAWRTVALLLAQVASATLLYCTLFPPPVAREAGTLVVLTARAGDVVAKGTPGDHVVALPEAPARSGIERVPDLATALRRYPATTRIRVLGAGLVARDRDAVARHAVDFQPAPLSRGLVELQSPARIPAGRLVAIAGRGEALRGGSVELLDPAGRRVDRGVLADDGRFRLHATTRGAGLALYRLRLRDARAGQVDDVSVPLEVVPARAMRVLVLAGAPNAELKYLRRWALDGGMKLDTRISLGAGLQVGTAPVGFDAATLGRFDLVVLDERSWRALGAGQRAAMSAAIDRGLGLLLRLAGPMNASDRERLRALGFSATSAGPARETRLGDGFVRAGDAADALPTLTRSALRIAASDGAVLLEDAAGAPLTVWRAHGRGRIGVSTLSDSYRLVLAGRGDAHGELWSRAFTTLARPGAVRAEVDIETAAPHQRTILCGIGARARIASPDGRQVALRIDPASGVDHCAGFWPLSAGWHAVRDGDRAMPFYVREASSAPGLAAQAMRVATQALAAGSPGRGSALQATQPGPRWPWFLAWLLLTTAAWWFERSRLGQPGSPAARA